MFIRYSKKEIPSRLPMIYLHKLASSIIIFKDIKMIPKFRSLLDMNVLWSFEIIKDFTVVRKCGNFQEFVKEMIIFYTTEYK